MTVEQRRAQEDPALMKEQMSRDEIVALFDRRQKAFDNLDAVAVAADYAPDCVVESPMAGTHQGRAAAQNVMQALFKAFPDLKTRTEQLLIDGNHVVQIVRAEGTDLGGFLGLPPTDKAFHLPVVSIFELRGRQIVRELRIYDFTGLLLQIGILKAKPI